jgi:hypothetical protein
VDGALDEPEHAGQIIRTTGLLFRDNAAPLPKLTGLKKTSRFLVSTQVKKVVKFQCPISTPLNP